MAVKLDIFRRLTVKDECIFVQKNLLGIINSPRDAFAGCLFISRMYSMKL